jgi:hypothetical protein
MFVKLQAVRTPYIGIVKRFDEFRTDQVLAVYDDESGVLHTREQ